MDGPARRAGRPLRPGDREGPLLLGAARVAVYLQLRLYRHPRHRQRRRLLCGRRPGLDRRRPGRDRQGLPVRDRVRAGAVPDAALRPGGHRQGEGHPGRLQGRAAVGLPRPAGPGGGAGDRRGRRSTRRRPPPIPSAISPSCCSSRRRPVRRRSRNRCARVSPASASSPASRSRRRASLPTPRRRSRRAPRPGSPRSRRWSRTGARRSTAGASPRTASATARRSATTMSFAPPPPRTASSATMRPRRSTRSPGWMQRGSRSTDRRPATR